MKSKEFSYRVSFWSIIGIVVIIIYLALTSCERLEYGEAQTYTVEAGQHDSDFPKLMVAKEEIFVKVFFHASCRANTIGPSGWNKLVGLMPGLDPHTNSARWAWRYDNDSIKLASYIYSGGKPEPEIKYIYSVPLEQGDFLTGDGWVELYVGYINEYWKLLTDNEMLGANKYAPGFGERFYITGLWFGGRGVPDQDVQVSYIFGEKKGFRINTD